MRVLIVALILILTGLGIQAQSLTASEVIEKVRDKVNGKTSQGTVRMTIVRPNWSRTLEMKTWSSGNELALILVTSPARDQGISFLKRKNEIWNWQPRIDRTIKLPPSMMMQSWMGSDFTNDDLIKESSIVEDYNHSFIGEEKIIDRDCHIIQMIPKENAPVVWGKVLTWVDKQEFIQLKAEFYDEENYLVNTMFGKDVKNLGGKNLPALLEMVPADKAGHMTIVKQVNLTFDEPLEDQFFSLQNMKRVR